MAVVLKLRCPDCAEAFKWPGDQKWPEFCPLCRAQLSTGSDEICMPFISSAKARSPDQVYRQMEQGAQVRAEAAQSMLGLDAADVSDFKMTNMKDHLRPGDTSNVPVVNEVSKLMDQHPSSLGFQSGGAMMSPDVQSGPLPNAGAKMTTRLRDFHAKTFGHGLVSDRPGLETEQPGYRRRG